VGLRAPVHTSSSAQPGAYGIRLQGLDGAAELLVPVAQDAPAYRVESTVGPPAPGTEHVDEDGAILRLQSGGRVLVDRPGGRVRFELQHPARPDELVHPYLAPAAAVINRWRGRESVHAGAIAVDGRALGVVGVRGAGKSSTLAWWALDGGEVLCDDLLVVDGRAAFVGPRSIDLREDAAAQLGAGEAIGVTGARERWRMRVGPATPGRRLAGWVFLAWGDRVDVRRLPPSERIPRIAAERGLRLPPVRPDALLELASLPTYELSRPRSWDSLAPSGERLLQLRL
jgi:hypothetical protein